MNLVTMPLGSYQTNCYLVWGENSDTCAVIDPGFEPETVLLKAQQLGKKIEAILLTHGHFDHVGGVKEIARTTGCRVYICPEEMTMPPQWTGGELFYTHTYTEGSAVELAGLSFRVLHTPGHTPGSVCLVAEDRIFSGDTLFQGSCGRTDLPGGSWSEISKSLKRLAGLEAQYTVYPGHGPATTLAEEKKFNPYMR